MNITTSIAPLFAECTVLSAAASWSKRPVSRWRPSRRAWSGEGLAAAGILAQQQERE